MTARRVVIIDPGYASYDFERRVLEEAGYRLDVFEGDRHDRAGRLALAQGAEGLLVRWTEVDGDFLDALPGLRALVRYGVGYDNIDIGAASARDIRVCNVQGYANHSVSDHALALMLACARALPLGQRRFLSHYNQPPRDDLFELREATLGIVGLGRIGGTLCRKAQPLFARVLACDPYIPPSRFKELGAIACSLPTLLAESRVISLHCNLTPETTRLIDRNSFAAMRQRPILVNTARGPVVDEDALLDALDEGRIHGAGLDVYWEEPPPADRDPLIHHPRVVATGHYAWYSEAANAELQTRAAKNMVALLRGELPEDCLNPI